MGQGALALGCPSAPHSALSNSPSPLKFPQDALFSFVRFTTVHCFPVALFKCVFLKIVFSTKGLRMISGIDQINKSWSKC